MTTLPTTSGFQKGGKKQDIPPCINMPNPVPTIKTSTPPNSMQMGGLQQKES